MLILAAGLGGTAALGTIYIAGAVAFAMAGTGLALEIIDRPRSEPLGPVVAASWAMVLLGVFNPIAAWMGWLAAGELEDRYPGSDLMRRCAVGVALVSLVVLVFAFAILG